MANFEIAKNGIWPKKIFREIGLFDFTSFFLPGLFTFFLARCVIGEERVPETRVSGTRSTEAKWVEQGFYSFFAKFMP